MLFCLEEASLVGRRWIVDCHCWGWVVGQALEIASGRRSRRALGEKCPFPPKTNRDIVKPDYFPPCDVPEGTIPQAVSWRRLGTVLLGS